jgi:hypothetical protein
MMALRAGVLKLEWRNPCANVGQRNRQNPGVMMSLLLRILVVVLFGAAAGPAFAIEDNGPPYTDQQFMELSKERLPGLQRQGIEDWWARAPADLRKRILNSPRKMWWPILLCNYFGFESGASGPTNSEKCEQDALRNSERGAKNWTPDGQWIDPSPECVKRDKRTKWGELICD